MVAVVDMLRLAMCCSWLFYHQLTCSQFTRTVYTSLVTLQGKQSKLVKPLTIKPENIARAFLPFRGLYTVHSQIFFAIISLRQFQLKCSPGFPEPPNQLGAEPLEQSQAKSPGYKKAMRKLKETSGHPKHAGFLKSD